VFAGELVAAAFKAAIPEVVDARRALSAV